MEMTAALEVLGALLASYVLAYSLWSFIYRPRRPGGRSGGQSAPGGGRGGRHTREVRGPGRSGRFPQ